jgi:hypothetical protein
MKKPPPATTPKAGPAIKLASGPKAETLRLSIPWQQAVKQSLDKPRPLEGWPKPGK